MKNAPHLACVESDMINKGGWLSTWDSMEKKQFCLNKIVLRITRVLCMRFILKCGLRFSGTQKGMREKKLADFRHWGEAKWSCVMMVALEKVPRDFITQESQQQHGDGGDSSSRYSPTSIHCVLRIGIFKKTIIILMYLEAYIL